MVLMRFFLFCVFMLSSVRATACNVPVFRYALERWRADNCDVVVFHDEALSDEQQLFVDQLEAASVLQGGQANMKVSVLQTESKMEDSVALLWQELRKQKDLTLPHLVVRSRVSGRTVNNWASPLDEAMQSGLLESPVRAEVSRRLLSGHSAVWLLLKGRDQKQNAAVREQLETELIRLSETTPIPEGIGLPGSELFSAVPLLMKFSVIEVDASDPAEKFLVETLSGFAPEAVKEGQPLVVPVFGRGRALEVLPGQLVNAGLIGDLTAFLCGACSCQVKERNPGFELLMTAAWEVELFGDDAEDVASQIADSEPAGSRRSEAPTFVEIPAGSSATTHESASGSIGSAAGNGIQDSVVHETDLEESAAVASPFGPGRIILLLVIVVIVIAVSRAGVSRQ